MNSRLFDQVEMEKDEAIRTFNQFRTVGNLWRSARAMVVLAAISWSAPRMPAAARMARGYCMDLAAYMLNQHVVFLVWNALAVALFVLCRMSGGGSEAATRPREAALPPPGEEDEEETLLPPAPESSGSDEGKQIVVPAAVMEKEMMRCEDVAAVLEKAARQIDRFQRTQSEKLREVIAVRPRSELRRSETEIHLTPVDPGDSDATAMETLSNEEFQRRVDAFIEEHWPRKR